MKLPFDNLRQDLRFAFRGMRRSAGFTAVAVTCLALGIGANTAVFSVVNAVMIRSLPVNRPDQLVMFKYKVKGSLKALRHSSSGYGESSLSYATFEALRGAGSFAGVFAFVPLGFNNHSVTVKAGPQATVAGGEMVSANYFSTLGVAPFIGRAITEEDFKPGAPNVAMLSYPYWSREFGGERAAIGRRIAINNAPFTVIGVAPPEFFGVDPRLAPDLWVPMREIAGVSPWGIQLRQGRSIFGDRAWWWCMMMGRLKPGVTSQQAQAEADVIFHRSVTEGISEPPKAEEMPHVVLAPAGRGLENLRNSFSKPLRVLMIAVFLVLLIACANVATLLLARAKSREKEMSVRLAVGASRARLIRQFLTESVLLALCGAGAGLLLARWGSRALLLVMSGGGAPIAVDVRPDLTVLAFSAGTAMLTGVLFGLAPALRATHVDLASQLKENAASISGRLTLAKALIAGQVAFSVLLLFGAGLFVRTLQTLQNQDLGFNREKLLLFELQPTDKGERAIATYNETLRKIQALPGVRSATASAFALLSGWVNSSAMSTDAAPLPPGRPNLVYWNVVGPDFMEAMGMKLVLGRGIGWQDMGGRRTAVINESLAREYFPGGSPIGHHFTFESKYDAASGYEVVGVVRDAKFDRMRTEPQRTAYVNYSAAGDMFGRFSFEVRTAGDPMAMAGAIREAVRSVDPNMPVIGLKTQQDQINVSLRQERMFARISSLFGVLALVLVSVGVYGTLAYAVTRRTGEIGIRMALGAPRGRVLWMVLRESLAVVACGLAIGLPAALVAARLVAGMLFGVKTYDAFTLAATVAILTAVGAAAGFLPALRASRVQPMRALRYE